MDLDLNMFPRQSRHWLLDAGTYRSSRPHFDDVYTSDYCVVGNVHNVSDLPNGVQSLPRQGSQNVRPFSAPAWLRPYICNAFQGW
jgi:hypothetical protein